MPRIDPEYWQRVKLYEKNKRHVYLFTSVTSPSAEQEYRRVPHRSRERFPSFLHGNSRVIIFLLFVEQNAQLFGVQKVSAM